MSFRADGVRLLITGGTSGLGAAMAPALVDAGAQVAITGRDGGRAEAAAEPLGAIGIGMRTVNPRFRTAPQPFWRVSPDGFRDLVATTATD